MLRLGMGLAGVAYRGFEGRAPQKGEFRMIFLRYLCKRANVIQIFNKLTKFSGSEKYAAAPTGTYRPIKGYLAPL